MKLTRKELIIVVILALLTALEALSIDLYLPAFQAISEDLKTDIEKVQISLSVFLGGFAVGQLLWGPLSDRFGRKWPLIIAIAIYTVSSVLVLAVSSIEELWLCRFMQAFSGSAGVVIARAQRVYRYDLAGCSRHIVDNLYTARNAEQDPDRYDTSGKKTLCGGFLSPCFPQ
ncbi:MFS transporter [Pontibacter sp. 13R65]|uniref:MFS transporter n=1 Tax=Pontibacter sp. 13R65 TaxID=3127458 RepID=UPI00301C976F